MQEVEARKMGVFHNPQVGGDAEARRVPPRELRALESEALECKQVGREYTHIQPGLGSMARVLGYRVPECMVQSKGDDVKLWVHPLIGQRTNKWPTTKKISEKSN